MAHSMLNYKHLPKNIWVEAVPCATYILNRCLTKSVLNMSPKEEWSGHKPDVAALGVFGSIAYSHVPAEKRKSLMSKVKNAFSLVKVIVLKAMNCLIQLQVQFLLVAMFSSVKMSNGNGRNQKKCNLPSL